MKRLIVAAVALITLIGMTYYAYAAGTTATITITYPTEGTRLNPVTGQMDTVPIALSEIQKAVIKWSVGATQVGSVDLIAPATQKAVPGLVCGDYNFTAYVVMKTGTAGPDYAPPAVYATGITCTTVPKAPAVTAS